MARKVALDAVARRDVVPKVVVLRDEEVPKDAVAVRMVLLATRRRSQTSRKSPPRRAKVRRPSRTTSR